MKSVQKVKQRVSGMIGLEIHGYLVTGEKLFCTCRASREKGLKKNSLICPICTGQPGVKPMLTNKEAVSKATGVGLMLGCKINQDLVWQRKHYDWPDMPKGYQNTLSGKHAIPLGVNGKIKGIRIRSIHLEEDPASWDPETGCVDYNRSGLPLVEIVTEPDFSNSDEVMTWLRGLVHNLAYLKAVDSNAGIKVDVNVSTTSPGSKSPGIRVEMKNISSIDDIGKAIDYELSRQVAEKVVSETRRYDSGTGKTVRMRVKEGADDYRFISDPDLDVLRIDKKFIDEVNRGIPESPEAKLKKVISKYKIGKKDAEVLTKNIDLVEFFEDVSRKVKPYFALHWIIGELMRVLNYNKKTLSEVEIKVEHFVELLELLEAGKITELEGKEILNRFVPKSFSPGKKFKGKITGVSEIEKIVDKVIGKNAKAVGEYNSGRKEALNFLIGQVMSESDKRADFVVVRKILEGKLN